MRSTMVVQVPFKHGVVGSSPTAFIMRCIARRINCSGSATGHLSPVSLMAKSRFVAVKSQIRFLYRAHTMEA